MKNETCNLGLETRDELLSPHFALNEFTESPTARKHGIDNTSPPEAVENLRALCVHTLEPLREALGLPVVITSGYRCKRLNDMLAHSSERSQHMLGQAADFRVGQSPVSSSRFQVPSSRFLVPSSRFLVSSSRFKVSSSRFQVSSSRFLVPSDRERLIKAFRLILTSPDIDFDQVILYPTFIHVSFVSKLANRHGILQAQCNGKLGYGRLTLDKALMIV